MLKFGVVALGVTDAQRAAEFWSAALGYTLREDGFGGWVDLHVADAREQEAEADRLISLGARRVDWDSYPEDPDFIVLEDPDGNRFCIVDLSHDHQ